uniref:Elongation of very long chain fatty acids protein 6 n=1 Tax=Monodelphis domestica TaxID=13616 RepID=F6UJ69_MONDO
MNMSVLTLQEYEFEKQFNENEAIQWMQENCSTSFLFAGRFLCLVFSFRYMLRLRSFHSLGKPIWIYTTATFCPPIYYHLIFFFIFMVFTKITSVSTCISPYFRNLLKEMFFVTKKSFLSCLGDTIFIILRKQKLIFLHWYHHITVLLYSWYSYKDMVAGGGWFMTMNYGVHAVMYSYYALRAAGFRVSRKFAMFITLSQITQMLMGLVVNYLVFYWMQQDQCHSHVQNIIWSSLMYVSYFVLFCHFFFEAYIGKMRKTRKAE